MVVSFLCLLLQQGLQPTCVLQTDINRADGRWTEYLPKKTPRGSPASARGYPRAILLHFRSLANCSRSFCRASTSSLASSWGLAPAAPCPGSWPQAGQCWAQGGPLGATLLPSSCFALELGQGGSPGLPGEAAPLQPDVHSRTSTFHPSAPHPSRTHTAGSIGQPPHLTPAQAPPVPHPPGGPWKLTQVSGSTQALLWGREGKVRRQVTCHRRTVS